MGTGIRRKNKLYRICSVLMAILVIAFLFAGSVLIADIAADNAVRFTPAYAKADLAPIADKHALNEEDYRTLYSQTGLGIEGIDALKNTLRDGETLSSRLKEYQDAFFYRGEREHNAVSSVTKRDIVVNFTAPIVPLEAGDVLITPSTHTFGYRHGHSAIVIDEYGRTLESVCHGKPSTYATNGFIYFTECTAFMVLRLKDADKAAREEIALAARKTLFDVPYSLTVGIFFKKNQGVNPKKTQCAHLVWQAFKNFGYDVDANGGALVTPRDIARSPYFEVVQIYGLPPDTLW